MKRLPPTKSLAIEDCDINMNVLIFLQNLISLYMYVFTGARVNYIIMLFRSAIPYSVFHIPHFPVSNVFTVVMLY